MIFFIIAAIALIISFYVLKLTWDKAWAKWVYAADMLAVVIMLVMFGMQFKINVPKKTALRRVVVTSLDISASTGIRYNDFKEIADKVWSQYSTEIIPFSGNIRGPEGAEATAMAKSLKGILSYLSANYDDDNIAGLVIITDGNETERINELNDRLIPAGSYPHNVLYLAPGGGSVSFDKSVSFVKVPVFMPKYSRETVLFSVNVAGGKLEGVPVDLTLNGKNIATVFVKLKDGYGEGTLEVIIKNTGLNLLEASVAADSRETVKDNNKDYASIEGIYKGFRVLHISGHPSTDTAFIRRGLQNIPGVDMISFYILRVNSQVSKTRDSDLSLIPFPTDQLFRDELDNFDLIIINDFRLINFLNAYYIDNIVKFVESGGGLLIFGGPESFLPEDFVNNKFETILPVIPSNGNYDNSEYSIRKSAVSKYTPLKEIGAIDNLRFTGLNRVKPKEWANVFFSTNEGSPVITGGVRGRARVLAVLTDSFWMFSYNAGIPNDVALKSLVRYVLGVSSRPVGIYDNAVSFDSKFKTIGDDVIAKIQFLKPDGAFQNEEIVKAPYDLSKTDNMLFNLILEQNGRVLDQYRLLNIHEKKRHEYSYIPSGKKFLQSLAETGKGNFVTADRNEALSNLGKMMLKDPVAITENRVSESPLYKHNGILLLFLYLIIVSFYLRSRYAA